MNYRRGLQRIFAVFAVAWAPIVFVMVFTGRWEPWLWSPGPAPTREPSEAVELDLNQIKPRAAPAGDIFDKVSADERAREAKEKWTAAKRWEWAFGLLLLPPPILYLLLFHVSRWVYRGFKPAAGPKTKGAQIQDAS